VSPIAGDPMNYSAPSYAPIPRLEDTVSGSSILREIKAAEITYLVTLPDITTSAGLLSAIEREREIIQIKVCREDEGIGICAGLSFTGKRALLLMQNTGLLDSINALRGVGVEYGLPICLMVGLLNKEAEKSPLTSENYGVKICTPILNAMGVANCLVETESQVGLIRPAIETAYETSQPTAILIGRPPLVS
jgi:sulfopyruvate decarboxylase TPP-binding subunit